MSHIFIGKDIQKEKDFKKIIEDISKKQNEIVEKIQNKFNIFDSEKRKYKLKMLAILYTTYISTLGSLEEKGFTIDDLNLIKSLLPDSDENNKFNQVINTFQNLGLNNSNSFKDLYEANMLKMEKKKNNLKISLDNKHKEEKKEVKKSVCIFCTEEFEENNIINPQITECKKFVHGKCFIDYIGEELNNNRFPIRCPLCPPNERHEINYKTIEDCLLINDKNNLAIKLENISLNHLAQNNPDEVTFCPTAGCNYMCFFDQCEFHLNCPLCKKEYCLKCKTEWHNNLTCEEYQKQKKGKKEEENDAKFEEYVKGSKLKQCPNCKRWVEKISGCDHIQCSCGTPFCYRCGNIKDLSIGHGCRYCQNYNYQFNNFGNLFNQGANNPFGLFNNNINNINQGGNLFGYNNQGNNIFRNNNHGNNQQENNIFGNNNGNNIFGNNNQVGNIFGNNQQENNIFGNNNNGNNLFTNNNLGGNIFGNNLQGNNIFGNNNNGNNIFVNNNQGGNIFGNNQQGNNNNGNNIFGNNNMFIE